MSRRVCTMVMCAVFAALIAAGAFINITIPVQPVPMHFTLQFFFVLLAGLLMEENKALVSVGAYLIIGLVGIPVFASGGGLAYIFRPTFGFLLGFAAASWMTSKVVRLRNTNHFCWMLVASVFGMAVMYLCGILYFYVVSNYLLHITVGWELVLINCCLLTIGGDFILCILASALAKRLRPAFQYFYKKI